jgi:flavin reductase (DIM6/NTAB) family NADH-FMN oxidoreductase RutF
LITAGGVFSLCTVDREDRAIVRKFTKPVEFDDTAMTLNGFPFREGVTGVPILTQAVGWVECEVRQPVETGNHTFFVGEVVDCGFQKDEGTPVLRMEDTRMSYGG